MKLKIKEIEQNENSRVLYKESDLSDLMVSMKKHGLFHAIGVRKISDNRYEAVYGNRRLVAARKLGWDEIDVQIRTVNNEVDLLIENLSENIKRKNTSLAEDGRTFKLLMDLGLNENEISARLDISKERIKAAIDVVAYVPVHFHSSMSNKGTPGPRDKKGFISPTVTHKLLNLRKTHQLSKPQFTQVLKKAQDGMKHRQISKISPLISSGMNMSQALREVENIRTVTLEILIDKKESEELEKKYKKTIRAILIQSLQASSLAKTIRPTREHDKNGTIYAGRN